MAFDGIVIANLVKEFSDALTGGKIAKITQTERDELLFTIKNFRETKRLLLSVNASLPLAYLTDTNKQGPMTAPNFCMLLRKHIGSGRIVSISQPGLERCIHFEIEHLDEMGDLCRKIPVSVFLMALDKKLNSTCITRFRSVEVQNSPCGRTTFKSTFNFIFN